MDLDNLFCPWDETPVPEQTSSYQPISHIDLLDLIDQRLSVKGYTIIRRTVDQNTKGERIAFKFIVKHGEHGDMTMMLAGVNSYDKSLAIKIASGASVFVCENGMVVGDIVAFRKHTTNMLNDLTAMIDEVVVNLHNVWKRTVQDVASMRLVPMTDEQTAELYGRLLITEDVITPTELNVAVKELRKPTYADFEPKNMWSTYNHVTWALKAAPVHRQLPCLKRLHEVCMDIVNDYIAITPYEG